MRTLEKRQLTGRTVLAVFIGFFLVVFAANGIMTFVAVKTFSGVETQDAYRKGRDYNETLEAARIQSAFNWQAKLSTVSLGGSRLAVGVNVATKQAEAIDGATVDLTLMRPTAQGIDVDMALEETAPGTFEGEVILPAPGNWKAILTVTSREGETFLLEEKLFVRE